MIVYHKDGLKCKSIMISYTILAVILFSILYKELVWYPMIQFGFPGDGTTNKNIRGQCQHAKRLCGQQWKVVQSQECS